MTRPVGTSQMERDGGNLIDNTNNTERREEEEEELEPVRDESAQVPKGMEKRRRMLSEVFARHQQDLEYVRRLSENITWQQQQQQQRSEHNNHGINFISAVRRKREDVGVSALHSSRKTKSGMDTERREVVESPIGSPSSRPQPQPPPPHVDNDDRGHSHSRRESGGDTNEMGNEHTGRKRRRRGGDSSESSNARSVSDEANRQPMVIHSKKTYERTVQYMY